ncbi:MAG: hypothetical protein WCZ12_01130 [Patescibacteria group bacterium]
MSKKRGVILIIIIIFLIIIIYSLHSRLSGASSERVLFFPDIHKGVLGLQDLKQSGSQDIFSGPLFYTTDGEPIEISKTDGYYSYDNDKLGNMLLDCGQVRQRIEPLVNSFNGSNMVTYGFKYAEEENYSYIVKLIANVKKYQSVDGFKNDFRTCELEKGFSIKGLSNNWLLFAISCDKLSLAERDDCNRIKNIVEQSLALNY